jgi:hypothetical protein
MVPGFREEAGDCRLAFKGGPGKEKPSELGEFTGLFLVAGAGFEPATFRL